MPTPGFPDWLGVGAVVRNVRLGTRHVIMDIEFQPARPHHPNSGAYRFRLSPEEDLANVYARARNDYINLPMMLAGYRFTGDYMNPAGGLTSTGTTMPVTMYAQGVFPGARIHIEGGREYDGAWTVALVYPDNNQVMLARVVETQAQTQIEEAVRRSELVRELLESGLADPAEDDMVPDPDFLVEPVIDVDPDPTSRPATIRPRRMFVREASFTTIAATSSSIGMMTTASAVGGGGGGGGRESGHHDMSASSVSVGGGAGGTGVIGISDHDAAPGPTVGQTWVLYAGTPPPGCSLGHWRATAVNGDTVELVNVRDANQRISTSYGWLLRHATASVDGTGKSEVWEIDPQKHRYKRMTNRNWLVTAERDDRVELTAGDGSGKRLFLTRTRLRSIGNYIGDGIHRRTAYERLLSDDDEIG
jgi:hypothetical protein